MVHRWVWLLVLGCVAGCPGDDTFQCVSDDQCGDLGRCEPNQYCSFPDAGCPSGRRYGDSAATGIAGQCVPESTGSSSSGVTPPSTGSTTSDATGTSTTSVAESSTSAVGTSTSTDTGSSSTTSDDSSSSSSSTDDGSSSSGEGSKCVGLPSNCEECLDCTTPSGQPCDATSAACFAIDGCIEAYDCMRTCFVDGLCFDNCCAGLTQSEADAAFSMAQCQMDVCEGAPVCPAFAEPTCFATG